MTVYDDWTKDSYGWFHCPHCDTAGDGVQILARFRECPELDAEDILAIKHPHIKWKPEARAKNKAYIEQMNQVFQDGNEHAHRRIAEDALVENKLITTGFRKHTERWEEHSGRHLRIVKIEEITELFSFKPSKSTRVDKYLVVIPMWHAPGLPSGCVAVIHRIRARCPYLRSRISVTANSQIQEKTRGMDPVGLAGLDHAVRQTGTNPILIYEHPLDMARDYTCLLYHTNNPPAMVSTYMEGYQAPYVEPLLFPQETVFRAQAITARIARVVCHLGERVSLYTRSKYASPFFVRGLATLRSAINEAKPFGKPVSDWLKTVPAVEMSAVFKSIAGDKHETVLSQMDPDIVQLINKEKKQSKPDHVDLHDGTVHVDNGRWLYCKGKKSSLVCEAATEIRFIQRFQAPEPHTIVSGVIKDSSGKEFEFKEDLEVIEKKSFRWLRDFLADNHSSVLINPPGFNPFRSDPELFSVLACTLGEAKILEASDQAGWSNSYNGWVFPGFNVNRQGKAEPSSMSLKAHKSGVAQLALPHDPSAKFIRWMSSKDSIWVWGLVDAVMCLALDRVTSRSVVNFEVRFANNPSADKPLKVLQALGCSTGFNFGWPVYTQGETYTISCPGNMDQTGKKYSALLDGQTSLPAAVLEYLPSLIPSALAHWLASSKSSLAPGNRHSGAREIVHQWFKSIGGRSCMGGGEDDFWSLDHSSAE